MRVVNYKPTCSNSVSYPLKQAMNNGITEGKNGMPQKFNVADGGASFSMGRNIYKNTTLANENNNLASLKEAYAKKKTCSCNNKVCSCISGKPVNIQSADSYIQQKKNQAIGKGSMPGQTNNNGSTTLAFKSQNSNTLRTALRRCRNSGCVAPAKKGAKPSYC